MLWIREVDGSFKNYITDLTKDLQTLTGKKIPVRMYLPKTDSQEEEYPLITLQGFEPTFNINHTDVNSFNITPTENGSVEVLEKPRKYDFRYNIDCYSKDPNLINEIAFKLVIGSRINYINIKDSEGLIHKALMTKETKVTRLDYVNKKGEVVYRRVYTFKLTVGIDISQPKIYGHMTDVNMSIDRNKEVNND